MWGWLKTVGKGLGSLAGISGGGFDYEKLADLLGAGGAATGAISGSKAQNRDAQLGAQSDLERALLQREGLETTRDRDFFDQGIQREQSGMATRDDAWRKLVAAQRTLSPGARPQLSPYSVAPRQITDMERQGADAMTQEVMARLTGGNPIQAPTRRAPLGPPAIDPRLMQPGKVESTLGWLAPILGTLGSLGKQGGPVGTPGIIPSQARGPNTFLDPRLIGGGSVRF